jgi:hypothetical protein
MFPRAFAWILLVTAVAVLRAVGEEGVAIRAKTVAHADGSYTEIVTDQAEMVSRATTYNAAGKIMGKVLNRLNDNFEPLTSYNYDTAGKPLYWAEWKRDLNGRVIQVIEYTPQNKLIRRVAYSYDSFGKLTGVKAFDSEGREIVARQKH